jgi:flavin reductase (DIM6/NTAB) family NADH-FMN oxidoreductase RutF
MKTSIGIQPSIFPNPAVVVCTYDKNDVPNGVTLAWAGIASSGPSSVSIAVRPSRYSHAALLERRAFTLNMASAKYVSEADYFGCVSGKDGNKFETTGLTPVRAEFVDAPYIAEFPVNLECAVSHTLELGEHTLFVGEILDVKIDAELEEHVDDLWNMAQIITYDTSTRSYRLPGEKIGKAYSAKAKFEK